MNKPKLSLSAEVIIARHSLLTTLFSMGFKNKTEMLKASIESEAHKLAFLERRGLLPDYQEFLNELKIESKILEEKKDVQEK
ncbi:hypothetical protein FH581_015355 [Leptospira weilii]|uniref:hypothetical protein n=1 Tax=Leptospira weilii TaxID=28184 RepID=UPI001EF37C19|nr:hypothetical protein [Leptospira weilii]ULH28716.1 hypothetical protein FH586_20930 [Leptospira weilii]ULH30030.1 hypothetical protein FH586_09345 [Leptospira weilii]UPY76776.1 hypothetical protein FH581_012525 [Leptospira weilii]UPY79583.1 hypothetical protein FH581_015355 [Leptospira weilii]